VRLNRSGSRATPKRYAEQRSQKEGLQRNRDAGPELPRGVRKATYNALVGCLVARSPGGLPLRRRSHA